MLYVYHHKDKAKSTVACRIFQWDKPLIMMGRPDWTCGRVVSWSDAWKVGAAVAALAYAGHGWGDLIDAVLEIGAASFPLLFIPLSDRQIEGRRPSSLIARSSITIVLAAIIYAVFVVCLGRGITS
jgi:hypothetical protein